MDHRFGQFSWPSSGKKKIIDKHNKIKIYSSDFEFPLDAKSPKSQINHKYTDNS